MKTRIAWTAAVILFFLAVPAAHAQQPTHRVSMGAGVGTLPDLAEALGSVLSTAFTLGSYTTEVSGTPVVVTAQYERFMSRRVAVLGAGGVQRIRRDVFVDGAPRGTLTTTYTHALAGLSVHYLRGQMVGLYSAASAGLGLRNESLDGDAAARETDPLLGLHVTALGLRVNRPLGAFVELGVGYRGVLAFGLAYEF